MVKKERVKWQKEVDCMKISNSKPIRTAKKGLFNIIFSRIFILASLVTIQLIVFGMTILYLQDYATYIYGIFLILSVIIVIYIINKGNNSDFKLTWILLIMAAPILGSAFYAFVKFQPEVGSIRKKLQKLEKETSVYMLQEKEIVNEMKVLKPANANLIAFMNNQISFPAHRNTTVRYFPQGEDKFEELKKQLSNAKRFIFMEYFIIEQGIMWGEILNILEEKVKEGVEVRVMYDGMCSVTMLPFGYDKVLKRKGIKCKRFNPILPVLSSHQNNRDHRKICVIDGTIAFTGGINLADEYINQKERFGHWKDTAVMLEGEAVQNFTILFLQMWNVSEKKPEAYEQYLNEKSNEWRREKGYVMPYGDSPFDVKNVGEQVYLHILNHAKKYVHIMTPYLIVDGEMISTLCYTAECGIDVKIIMPHIPDKWYAFLLAKTYYKSLLKAGVKIYEYTPGFVHAKMFVSDDDTATVGTINLDYRSLYHHFECGTFIYSNPVVWEIEKDFQKTLKKCQEVTLEDLKRQPFIQKVCGHVLRLVAPLM